jgi:hypothetical protein
MLAAAPRVRVRIKWRLESVGMASAPVGCVAEYCPNGDWENLGSRSKYWVTGFTAEEAIVPKALAVMTWPRLGS